MTRTREQRYLGYREADERQPYAKYMQPATAPAQPRVTEAIAQGPVDPSLIPRRRDLAAEFHQPGYSAVETGYGRLPSGQVWVACLTDMPRVEPAMWDWWFGWHLKESARYKLWHPTDHAFAAVREDRSDQPGLTDTAKYRGNVSFVDEFIGGRLDQLAIAFRDPASFGIDLQRFDGTAICGTVGTVLAPVNVGIVCHQVRRTVTGSEMRSRFYLNAPSLRRLDLKALAATARRGIARPRAPIFRTAFGAHLLKHCGEEMNHLAQFLPELHGEFGGEPSPRMGDEGLEPPTPCV